MGKIISYFYGQNCATCDGAGNYPYYRECYECRGTGYEYSFIRGLKNTIIPHPPSRIDGLILVSKN